MKAKVILDDTKFNNSIMSIITNTRGISNVVIHKTNNTLTLQFSTHNTIEGLREKLLALGLCFELIY